MKQRNTGKVSKQALVAVVLWGDRGLKLGSIKGIFKGSKLGSGRPLERSRIETEIQPKNALEESQVAVVLRGDRGLKL